MPAHFTQKGPIMYFFPLKYCYIRIWAEMQVNHAPSSELQNPTSHRMPVNLPWIREDCHLLHERIKDRALILVGRVITNEFQKVILVVGVITNEFHKVLAYIFVCSLFMLGNERKHNP